MKSPHHLARALLTFFGCAAFLMLALGSADPKPDYSTYSTPPEIVGQENALTWVKTRSPDIAKRIRQLEMRRDNAQCEVRALENLKEQFPVYASKTEEKIKEWQRVIIDLDSALTALTESASAAYHAHQAEGKDSGVVLEKVYSQWSPRAERAIALAKKQRTKSRACQ